jgi:hypothetical protein
MLMSLAITLHPEHDLDRQRLVAVLAGRLGYAQVVVPSGRDDLVVALRPAVPVGTEVVADDPTDPHVVRTAALADVAARRESLVAQGQPEPLVVAVPLSIGRTRNEADARASRDPRFVGDAHPQVRGVFGTFEQAQQQVIELAGAGATMLRVTLADDPDIADLLAQVRALVVGPTVVLHQERVARS